MRSSFQLSLEPALRNTLYDVLLASRSFREHGRGARIAKSAGTRDEDELQLDLAIMQDMRARGLFHWYT